MTGMMERLTYILGICVAVIGWSVTQLSTSLTSDQILAYRLKNSSIDAHTNTTILHLENLSRTKSVSGQIVISPTVDTNASTVRGTCIRDTAINFQPVDLAATYTEDPNKKTNGYLNAAVTGLLPGQAFDVYIRYPAGCAIFPQFDLLQNTSPPRLLQFGVETYVIVHRFAIILFLLGFFAIVFMTSFAISVWIALKKDKQDETANLGSKPLPDAPGDK